MFNSGLEEGSVDAESAVLRDERLDLDGVLDVRAGAGPDVELEGDAPAVVVSAWSGLDGDAQVSVDSSNGHAALRSGESPAEAMSTDEATGDETPVEEPPVEGTVVANGAVDDTVVVNGAVAGGEAPADDIAADDIAAQDQGPSGFNELEIRPQDLQRFDSPPLPGPVVGYGPHPEQSDQRYEEYLGRQSREERYTGEFRGDPVPEYRSTSDDLYRENGVGVHDLAPAESGLDVDEYLNSIGVDVEELESKRGSRNNSLEISMSAVSGVVAGAIGMALLIGFGALVWQIASSRARDTNDEVSVQVETSPVFDVGTLDVAHEVDEFREILDVLGLDGVNAELDGSVIHLTGMVQTHEEFQSVIAASSAVADGVVVDTSELVVADMATEGEVVPPGDQPEGAPGGRPEALQSELNRIVAATPLIFEAGSSRLTEIHLRVLNNVAASMNGYPNLEITVVGFTDSAGEPEGNQRLSEARAHAVIDHLAMLGVDPDRLVSDAQGEETSTGADRLAGLERVVEFEVQEVRR